MFHPLPPNLPSRSPFPEDDPEAASYIRAMMAMEQRRAAITKHHHERAFGWRWGFLAVWATFLTLVLGGTYLYEPTPTILEGCLGLWVIGFVPVVIITWIISAMMEASRTPEGRHANMIASTVLLSSLRQKLGS